MTAGYGRIAALHDVTLEVRPGELVCLIGANGAGKSTTLKAISGLVRPTAGRISVEFGGRPGPGTGLLIDGRQGQPIVAAASGIVVYAGSGLIGYGELIIIKHNDTYLSAYGYNAKLLVREGQTIVRGQQVALMGEGPERKPRLHFEIRRNGQPVNPRQFLPAR